MNFFALFAILSILFNKCYNEKKVNKFVENKYNTSFYSESFYVCMYATVNRYALCTSDSIRNVIFKFTRFNLET